MQRSELYYWLISLRYTKLQKQVKILLTKAIKIYEIYKGKADRSAFKLGRSCLMNKYSSINNLVLDVADDKILKLLYEICLRHLLECDLIEDFSGFVRLFPVRWLTPQCASIRTLSIRWVEPTYVPELHPGQVKT